MVLTEYILSAPCGSVLLCLPELDVDGSAWLVFPSPESPEPPEHSPQPPASQHPKREPLRIAVYGSPQAITHVINWLHVVRFEEQFRWNESARFRSMAFTSPPRRGKPICFC